MKAKARIGLRVDRIELSGNLGNYRMLRDGIGELKIDCGPGYRAYFSFRGEEIVLLVCGGDKSTQRSDIKRAVKINAEYQ